MNSFLPPNYEVPTAGNYMRLEDGANRFLILGSAVLGYEYWNLDGKPVRLIEYPKNMPADIRPENDGKKTIKHFWAFPVYDYRSKKVQVLEVTQKGIMGQLQTLAKSEDWGDPIQTYPITINRSGEGLNTDYTVVPSPKVDLTSDIGIAWEKVREGGFDLARLFEGGDPFSGGAETVVRDADAQA